ncbi:MAG: hypothetical protein P4L41_13485 [Flavipsychrobacter sp.]|nr:hypothetical protein [Flavipsychrobacter sp.]
MRSIFDCNLYKTGMSHIPQNNRNDRWLAIATWLIIGIGILLRIVVFLQSRNLFIDEANIARNVYERTFAGLAMPLSYEQYAPPIFLWILKVSTILFGFGEDAFRLYTLLMSIGALLLFTAVMSAFDIKKGLLYPLFLFATGLIFVRYSTEVKQYMPDVFICLLLVWLAMKIDVLKNTMISFVAIWFLLGTLSIWSSMPSVFVLAGVGMYYGTTAIKQDSKKLMPVIIVSILWLMQFLFYYTTILKPQADSEYLHNFHKDYFIFLIPVSLVQLQHNIQLVGNLLSEAGGYTALVTIFNGLLLLTGGYLLFRKNLEKALLVVVPIVCLYIAAGLSQFSLIPRVSLFIMPFMLLLIGYGFNIVLQVRSKVVLGIVVAVAFIGAYNHNQLKLLIKPLRNEEITDGMKLLKDNKLTAKDVYVHMGAAPAFIYYTEIHPAREQWQTLKYAHVLKYGQNCDAIAQTGGQLGFLYANGNTDEMNACKDGVLKHMIVKASFEEKGCSAYVYATK